MIQVIPLQSEKSPVNLGYRREQAKIIFQGEDSKKIVWIDVPEYRKSATNSNHWLILGFLLAHELNTDIHVEGEVDDLLLKNLKSINYLFNNWFKKNNIVSASATKISRISRNYNQEVGLFFSGGVDSMFSLFDDEARGSSLRIRDLITVWGFDIPLSKPEEFQKLHQQLNNIAIKTNSVLIPVITNLRSLGEPYAHLWGERGHGAALAAIGHLFSAELTEVRIASSFDYENIFPWGSHPYIDPLFSSSNLSVVHDGAAWSRVDKTRLLTDFDIALDALHVCHKMASSANCSHCSKCIRTMLTIDCFGAKDRANAFDWSEYNLKTLEPILISNWLDRAFFVDIDRAADLAHRTDIRNFILRSKKYSKWIRPIPGIFLDSTLVKFYISMLKNFYSKQP